MANNFNLSVDEDDIEKLLEVVPERLTNECCIRNAELNTRQKKKETEGEKNKEENPRKFSEGFSKSLCRPQRGSLKVCKYKHREVFINRNVHGAFSAYKVRRYTSSRRASGRSLRRCSRRRRCYHR